MALPAVLLGVAAALSLPALGYVASGLELLIAVGGLALWWMPYLAGPGRDRLHLRGDRRPG